MRSLLHSSRCYRCSLTEKNLFRFLADRRRGIDFLSLGISPFDGGAISYRFKPALEMWEVLKLLALPLVRHHPGIDGHISDRIAVGDELAIRKTFVEHAIEAVGLLHVTLDRVRDLFRRILREMVILTRHRSEPSHLPEQPFHDYDAIAQAVRQISAGFVGKIDEDGAGLEDRKRIAPILWAVIDDRRHAIVRGNRQKFRPKLLTLADIDGHDPIRKPGLLKEDRDLVAIRRGPIVEIDHRFAFRLSGGLSSASAGRTTPSIMARSGLVRANTRTPSNTPSNSRAISPASTSDETVSSA